MQGLPRPPIRTSQGFIGSCPNKAASNFLSRCAFSPWDDPAATRVAVEAPPATFFTWAAVAASQGCVIAYTAMAAAAATGTVPAPVASAAATSLARLGPDPDKSHLPRTARVGGCCGDGSSFSRPCELFCEAPASSSRGSAIRSTRTTGAMVRLLRFSHSSALLCPPESEEPAGASDDCPPGPPEFRGADEDEDDEDLCPDDLLFPYRWLKHGRAGGMVAANKSGTAAVPLLKVISKCSRFCDLGT